MTQPHYILLPVNSVFIIFSLALAFLLNFLPWGGFIAVPDFVALVLVFWSIHQPRKVGIGVAFTMGLLMDVHDAIHLGENALAYTLPTCIVVSSIDTVFTCIPVVSFRPVSANCGTPDCCA